MSILGNPVCLPIGGKAAKGSHMFLGISLPRSIYYEQAADWLKIKDNPKPLVSELNWDGQVVCGNALWEFCNNHAYAYSLENGDLLEDITLSGITGQCCQGIATDGKSRIWILRLSLSVGGSDQAKLFGGFILYEFNIGTKSLKSLYSSVAYLVYSTSSYYSVRDMRINQVNQAHSGIIGYSPTSNKVYFGKLYTDAKVTFQYKISSGGSWGTQSVTANGYASLMCAYDLSSNSGEKIADYPHSDNYIGQYFYDDGDFFYTGGGYDHYFNKEKYIIRYNKLSSIWETLLNNFEGYAVGPFSYVQIGDKMLQISKDATGVFDPKTGNLEQSTVPTVPPDSMVMYPGFKAYANNILYLVTNQGIYKCPFFSEIPEDAPIVAKIYKGQKYHTLEPFEIPNKIKFLRTQQIADKDYEIKMYEYASEGGQTIFIEDVGE